MPFPAGVATTTCTFGNSYDGIGDGWTITATVTLVLDGARRLVWTATGDSFNVRPGKRLEATAGAALSFDVAQVDQDGFTDGNGNEVTGWHYRLDWVAVDPTRRNNRNSGHIDFSPTSGDPDPLDLDNLPDGQVGTPVFVPQYASHSEIATLSAELDTHEADHANPHAVTKTQVGLGSVDNTADSAKPVSTAQATAIANAQSTAISTAQAAAAIDAANKVATEASARATAITTAINNLINGAPGALDTLDELAAALQSDESAAAALTTAVAGKLAKSANLSDLASVATARTNLGISPNVSSVGRFYVDPTNGNDANDGLTWPSAVATIAQALTLCANHAQIGEINLSRGIHNVTSTLVIPQAVKLRGFGSLISQETEIVWTGADDGSYVIRTSGDTSGNDFTRGEISDVLVRPNSSKPGGGAYTNLNGIYARNLQNGAFLRGIRVQNFPGKGLRADWSNAGVPANGFPGFATFERVWCTGNTVNWHIFGGFTSVLYLMCAGDVSSNTTDVFILDPPTGGSLGGRPANHIFIGFKAEDNGTPTGAGADPNYFTVNTDCAIGFDGCSAKRGLPGTKPWINYTVTPSSQNNVTGTIPVAIRNSHTSNLPVAVQGPGGATLLAPTVGTGGQTYSIVQWSGHASAPIKWSGTHSGFNADGAQIAGADPTVAALRVSAAPGASVPPVEFAAGVFTHTFTAADSTSAIAAPDIGPAGTAGVGTWGISSNKAYLVSATHNAEYAWTGVGSDGTLSADITRSSGAAFPGLQFRRIDASNALVVRYKSSTGELLLQKVVAGPSTGLKAANVTWAAGTTKKLSITAVGSSVKVYLDGVLYIDYTLSTGDQSTYGAATGIGLRQQGFVTAEPAADDGGSRYDNVSFVASVVRVTTGGVLQVRVSGTWTDVSTGSTTGTLLAANNLSDLASASTARTNLSLGTAALTNTGTGSTNTILGNDARLTDSRTPTTHSHAESDVTGLTTDLAAKAPTSRLITAGTGLTGGGDLTADRTLTVAYGTSSSTAAVGNDARLSDARTPTAHATSHAEGGSDALAIDRRYVRARLTTSASLRAETAPRFSVVTGALSAGILLLARISLQAGSYTTVTMAVTGTGSSVTNAFYGLYDTSSLALLATSSSAVTAMQTAGLTGVTMNYTATAGDYYLGVLCGGGTPPTVVVSGIGLAALAADSPAIALRHSSTGLTALPNPFVAQATPSGLSLPWMRYE